MTLTNVVDNVNQEKVNVVYSAPLKLTLKNILLPFFLHLTLCTTIFITNSNKALIPVLLFFTFFYYKRNNAYFLMTGLYAICFSSDVVYYIYAMVVFMLLLLRTNKNASNNVETKWIKKCAKIFLGYCLLLYPIQLVLQGSVLSLPMFSLTFITPSVIMFYVWKINISNKELQVFFRQLLAFALAQAFIAFFFEAVPIGISAMLSRPTLGDQVLGTTNSSNSLAALLFFSILPFLTSFSFKNRRNNFILFSITVIFLGLLILNDSKTTVMSILLSVGVTIFQKYIFLNKNVLKGVLNALMLVTILIFSLSVIEKKLANIQEEYDPYITGKYNKKIQYYLASFNPDTRSVLEFLIGTGPGTNGSRAANSLAYDVLYHKKNRETLPSFIPPKTNDFTRQYLSPLYSQDYAESTGTRSAVLGNPYNSICAFFVEFGVLGLLVLIGFLFKISKMFLKSSNWITIAALCMVISNFIIAFIDQTFEIIVPMFLMYLMIGLACRNYYTVKIIKAESTDVIA